ncbi:MAG: hypothetical protein K8W52_00920 [Deltaproteobacteria bacterium]|nr:hypothetical protein [Deltaproteobacteria bacterium]
MPMPDRIFDTFASVRRRVRDAISSVNRTTESETIAVGTRLQRIVALGSEHIARLKSVLGASLGHDDEGLVASIQRQSRRIQDHLQEMTRRLQDHRTQVGAAASRVTDITETARQIATLNSEARILALNARIEAARAGEHGRGFAVLAGEMNRLSQAIAQASVRIQGLGTELNVALPRLRNESEALEAMTSTFGVAAREDIDGLEQQVHVLQDEVHAAVRESDRVLVGILDDSHQALSHLQFQDVCAQTLRVTDGWLAEGARAMAAELGRSVDIEPAEYTTIGDGDRTSVTHADSPPAGEVNLF